jgi:beta-ribofuranosylaminobenzene 5'-phosphate synthase
MVQDPHSIVRVVRSEAFNAFGPQADRAVDIAHRFAQYYAETVDDRPVQSRSTDASPLPPCHVHVESLPAPHTGLGTGTQLGLAIAEAIRTLFDLTIDRETLAARIAKRGRRSAVGFHGFYRGGLIVETGKANDEAVGNLQHRLGLPVDWRWVLLQPKLSDATVSGGDELQRFAQLPSPTVSSVQAVNRLLQQQLVPALCDGAFDAASDALHSYNHAVGQWFGTAQGGPFNGQAVAQCVQRVRTLGYRGVGQSSWGPTVFVLCRDQDHAQALVSKIDTALQPRITITRDQPAAILADSDPKAS